MSLSDDKILSYNDVVLRQSDLGILNGHFFLNDRIIEFYFSYLASCHASEDILLVPPSIAFWITNCPDKEGLKDFIKPLNLSGRNLVLFPVNNNDDVSMPEGGSHWSLLAFLRSANVFVHHDSNGGVNSSYAKRLYKAVVPCTGMSNMVSKSTYLECSTTPQQLNGYDCGLYVTAIARAICDWYGSGGPRDEGDLWFSTLNKQVTPLTVAQMRNEIRGLIASLMKN